MTLKSVTDPLVIESTIALCAMTSFGSTIKSFEAKSESALYGRVFLLNFEELKSKV